MIKRYILFFILGIDALVLFFQTSELSISYDEAYLFYDSSSVLHYIVKSSIYLFGRNDFALRLPMIVFHLLSVFLLYKISKSYVKRYRDRLWLIIVFILLPGVISSAIVINSAGLIIFGLLFFIYVYEKFNIFYTYPLLLIFAFFNASFVYLFIALVIYSFIQKDKISFYYNFLLFFISVYLYGFETYGSPSGHFLDFIGVYSAIFTPIIFVYIVYVLYKRYFIKNIDIIWYISTTAFLFSLLLSFRQRVSLEHFAPYLIIALPLSAQTFISSYKVRLKRFRKGYKSIFVLSLLFLILNSIIVLFNKELYLFLDNPKENFTYKMHIAKELAGDLKQLHIKCIDSDKKISKRIEFYGISYCKKYSLNQVPFDSKKDTNVTISYFGKVVYKANVTKINNK